MDVAEQIATYGHNPHGLLIGVSAFLAASTVAFLLRLYVRGFIVKAIGPDDLLLSIAQCLYIVYCTVSIISDVRVIHEGFIQPLRFLVRNILLTELTYIFVMIFIKFALGAFFLRILITPWHRWLIYGTLGVFTTYGFILFFVVLFQCGVPNIDALIIHQNCLPWSVFAPINYVGASLNAITDWTMTLIPVMVIRQLQVNKRDKIAAMVLVGLGSVSSIISVVRIPLIKNLAFTGNLHFFGKIQVVAWISTAEAGIALIAISIAAYRPLWDRVRNRLLSTTDTLPTSRFDQQSLATNTTSKTSTREHFGASNAIVVSALLENGKPGIEKTEHFSVVREDA